MGLRCSLLGHAYADPEIERERDDRGDEVVVTVRETKTCERCGAETVVSENTEVRPVEPEPEPEPESDPASAPSSSADPAESPAVDDEFEPPASAAEDDGVILDEDDDEPEAEPDREPGEWPEAEDTRVEEPSPADADDVVAEAEAEAEAASESDDGGEIIDAEGDGVDVEDASPTGGWPDTGAEDEGFDASPNSGDGDVDMGGLTPRGVADAEDEGEAVVGGDSFGTGIESSETTVPGRSDDVDVDAEFVCPACDYTEPVLNSSLREGDICPECQRGYLAEESPTRN
ncbi:MAG: oxidoreductase [Halobacteriaceae archaeon]